MSAQPQDIIPKDQIRARVDRELAQSTLAPQWSTQQKLALACRMLAEQGHWRSGLAGQITTRGEAPGTFWTLRFGLGADEAVASELILIDENLKSLNGPHVPNPATRFHVWIYRQRPEVNCIVHTHPPATAALSMIGEELAVAHMDATPFFEDCAYLSEWPGLPIGDDEGKIISGALQKKRAILLAHHGLLTAGATIEEAAVMALWLEQAADLHLRARAVGPIQPILPERARESHDFLVKPEITGLTFAYFARRVLRHAPETIK